FGTGGARLPHGLSHSVEEVPIGIGGILYGRGWLCRRLSGRPDRCRLLAIRRLEWIPVSRGARALHFRRIEIPRERIETTADVEFASLLFWTVVHLDTRVCIQLAVFEDLNKKEIDTAEECFSGFNRRQRESASSNPPPQRTIWRYRGCDRA